jgi:hypothetical protein
MYHRISIDGSEEEGQTYTYVQEDLLNAKTREAFDLFVPDPALQEAIATVRHGRKQLGDQLWVRFANWFLISERAWKIFSQMRCCVSLRWVNTKVCHKGKVLAEYRLAYGAEEHDIWDYRRSDFYWSPGKTPHTKEAAGYMRDGVIDRRCVPEECDFFKATHCEWIGTERLRLEAARAGLTNFEFRPIKE